MCKKCYNCNNWCGLSDGFPNDELNGKGYCIVGQNLTLSITEACGGYKKYKPSIICKIFMWVRQIICK